MNATHVPTESSQEWEYQCPETGGLLVGVDGSPESIAALETAADLARRCDVALHTAIVIPEFPSYRLPPDSDRGKAELDELRTLLKKSELDGILRVIEPGEAGWTREVLIGNAVSRLSEIAEDRNASIIVVGRHEHGTIDHALGLDTTERLMRKAPVPVLAVREPLIDPHTAVAAIDFSPSSVEAARAAASLLNPPGVLFLAYVESAEGVKPSMRYEPATDLVPYFRRVMGSINAREGVLVLPCVLSTPVVDTLLEQAVRVGADVLSAGSHGRNTIERALLGSVSTALVRKAKCAVLIARAKE